MEPGLLVVEDDVFLREGLCEMLRREGYAADCAEGMCRIRRETSQVSSKRNLGYKGGAPWFPNPRKVFLS